MSDTVSSPQGLLVDTQGRIVTWRQHCERESVPDTGAWIDTGAWVEEHRTKDGGT